VVIACTPRAHREMEHPITRTKRTRSPAERTLKIKVSTGSAIKDAAMFFPNNQFADRDQALGQIVTAASHFGHYSIIARIAELLRKSTGTEKKEVEAAIRKAQVQMGRTSEDWDGN
jgi:hypothetical protein